MCLFTQWVVPSEETILVHLNDVPPSCNMLANSMEEHLTLAIPNIKLEPKESLTKEKRKEVLEHKIH